MQFASYFFLPDNCIVIRFTFLILTDSLMRLRDKIYRVDG